MIKTLNEKFVNTWVFLRELPELIGGARGEGTSRVAAKLQHHYSDSVDILMLSSEAEVLAHQPEMALPYRGRTQAYLRLLNRTLEAIEGRYFSKLEAKPISLGRKFKEVLHVIRASSTPDYTIVDIDTTSFEHDGILYMEIQVGGGNAAGTFELFDGDMELATNKSPDEALTGAWNVPPGGTGHIIHDFKRGQRFKLRANGGKSNKEGSINAFNAHISVVQESDETGEW